MRLREAVRGRCEGGEAGEGEGELSPPEGEPPALVMPGPGDWNDPELNWIQDSRPEERVSDSLRWMDGGAACRLSAALLCPLSTPSMGFLIIWHVCI